MNTDKNKSPHVEKVMLMTTKNGSDDEDGHSVDKAIHGTVALVIKLQKD